MFGCAWKIWSNKKLFPLTVKYPPHTRKSFYTLILTSNYFHSLQKISLLIHSHHSRQAQVEGRRELSPMKPRSSPRPMAPPVWSRRSNLSPIWSRRLSSSIVLKPISNESGLIVLRLHRVISPLDRTQSPLSLPSSLNLTEFDDFFLGFVSFVFLCLEMILYICLEAEKMWATNRKCVFYCIFKNITKH